MIYLLLVLTSASLILSLLSLYKLRDTRSALAITRASHLALKERLKGDSLDFEGFSASDLLALQELIDNASALTTLTEETTTLLEEYSENLESLVSLNTDDIRALQALTEYEDLERTIDDCVSDYVSDYVTEQDLEDALNTFLCNLVIKRQGEL
jgi:hypothetical protein